MLQSKSQAVLQKAIHEVVECELLPACVLDTPIVLTQPTKAIAGDFTTTFCMRAAKAAGMKPEEIWAPIDYYLKNHPSDIQFEWCLPGFINVLVPYQELGDAVEHTLANPDSLCSAIADTPLSYSVEYVSVNPNGPITVAAARGAALGDVLSNTLKAAGHTVTREYYINDGVNSEQMRLFAESVQHHVKTSMGLVYAMPENGYKGEYVEQIATELTQTYDGDFLAQQDTAWYQAVSQAMMIAQQKSELELFGVEFDLWTSEQSLIESGKVAAALSHLENIGSVITKDGAKWLLTEQYGDVENRVLVREDGRMTYATSDIAYHLDKYARGHDKLIDLLGPDHHGYVPRLKAGIAASGKDPDSLTVVIFQTVRFIKNGQAVIMRKRDGNLYTLSDLMKEIATELSTDINTAKDVVRFFYLYVTSDKHMDFDISLAIKQASDNPCFYVKYAHARCCSILKKAGAPTSTPDWSLAQSAAERNLIVKCLYLPELIAICANDLQIHRFAHYAVDVSKALHEFYEQCKVIQPDEPQLTASRLQIVALAQLVLAHTSTLLGISAPEAM